MKISKAEISKIIEELHACQHDDVEVAHCDADSILCDLLERLGYGNVVEAWHEVPKWYA